MYQQFPPKPFNRHTEYVITPHFEDVLRKKGFSLEDALAACRNPKKRTSVSRHPHQWRFCGAGLAVIVDYTNKKKPELVTVYLDGVITPLREDQKNDLAAVNSGRIAVITQKEFA